MISTPTILTFPQLQNYCLHTALHRGWYHFFSSHMDTFALSVEDYTDRENYQSLYMRVVHVLRELLRPDQVPWGLHSFANNGFVLVNVGSCIRIGGWDTAISGRMSDCDFHNRLRIHGMKLKTSIVGEAYHVTNTFKDLVKLYSRSSCKSTGDIIADINQTNVKLNSSTYQKLKQEIVELAHFGSDHESNRNTHRQGGQGDPFYRTSRHSIHGHKEADQFCDGLIEAGLRPEATGRIEHTRRG